MIEQDRLIGKVIAVQSENVVIELEKDSKTLTKTFVTGTYPIARLNSYVIMPVGAVMIVGIVTRVSMAKEDVEITPQATLALPQPKRNIFVTMVGTLERENDKLIYKFGIKQFPTLDNPVWFILDEELDIIFDKEYNTNYFIPIGSSTAYPEYEIKLNPNKLFARHLGVLGNTGAGKSHTIASMLQTILRNNDIVNGQNSHIIIFDTNGEYKQAFSSCNENNVETLNFGCFDVLYFDKESLQLPYWFMNYNDWISLLQPKEGSQLPVLSKALLYARNPEYHPNEYAENDVLKIINEMKSHFSNRRRTNASESEDQTYDAIKAVDNRVSKLSQAVKNYVKNAKYDSEFEIDKLKDVDCPSHFEREYFRKTALDYAISESGTNAAQIRSYCESMFQRMDRFFKDPRYDFIFHNYPDLKDFPNLFATFLRLCFGRLKESKITEPIGDENNSTLFINKYLSDESIREKNKNYQVIIFDLNLVPSDILHNVASLLGRLVLEFLQRLEKTSTYRKAKVRSKFPVVMVLEEAHNYIPENIADGKQLFSKEVFERIAREGRKYGLSLIVSSQRPSELSKTVLSQCNSFFVHRVQNPEDQLYIKKLLPSVSQDLLNQLPVLAPGVALIFGDCVRAPMQVEINMPNPTPKSDDPRYWEHWTGKEKFPDLNDEPDFEKICAEWEHLHSSKEQ